MTGDEEDAALEWAKSVARHFREVYEDEAFNNAVAAINGMPVSSDVPMPNTCHPAYANLHINLDKARSGIRIKMPQKFGVAGYLNNETELKPETLVPMTDHFLVRKRCAGPAPFVGDPIWEFGVYFWDVWVDDLGRHVAGDSKLDLSFRTVPLID